MTEGKDIRSKESRWIWFMQNDTVEKAEHKRKKAHTTADVGVTRRELQPQSQWMQEAVEASETWGSVVV